MREPILSDLADLIADLQKGLEDRFEQEKAAAEAAGFEYHPRPSPHYSCDKARWEHLLGLQADDDRLVDWDGFWAANRLLATPVFLFGECHPDCPDRKASA